MTFILRRVSFLLVSASLDVLEFRLEDVEEVATTFGAHGTVSCAMVGISRSAARGLASGVWHSVQLGVVGLAARTHSRAGDGRRSTRRLGVRRTAFHISQATAGFLTSPWLEMCPVALTL